GPAVRVARETAEQVLAEWGWGRRTRAGIRRC
ncbi:hypothetical protein GA0115255_125591, partial [Streptomyces sp. Ncost-T6T-2b]